MIIEKHNKSLSDNLFKNLLDFKNLIGLLKKNQSDFTKKRNG